MQDSKVFSLPEKSAYGDLEIYSTHLFIGEGDFSYAFSVIKENEIKYPYLASHMIVTSYDSESELKSKYHKFVEHRDYLLSKNITIFYGVDARNIHVDIRLKDMRFDIIHFNFPHDGQEYNSESIALLLGQFYKSASVLQEVGGRVHMALPKPPDTYKRKIDELPPNVFYKAYVYNIYENTSNSGYLSVNKHPFGPDCLANYKHVQTKADLSANVADQYGREYIFAKTDMSPAEIYRIETQRNQEPKKDAYTNRLLLPEMETDSEASEVVKNEIKRLVDEIISDKDKAKKRIEQLKTLIGKHLQHISSLKECFTEDTKITIYTHIDPLEWKSHITTWYFKAQNDDDKANSIVKFPELFIEFLNALLFLIKNYSLVGAEVSNVVLSCVFELRQLISDDILDELLKLVIKENVVWESKAIILSIFVCLRNRDGYNDKYVIPSLLPNIGYDPRLDWLVCSFLGLCDLSRILIDLAYKDIFVKLKDLRLMYKILKSTDPQILYVNLEKLPNIFYKMLARYHYAESTKDASLLETDECLMMKNAVFVQLHFSMAYTFDKLTRKKEFLWGSLIEKIYISGTSIYLYPDGGFHWRANIKGRDCIDSFMAIGNMYRDGKKGHAKNLSKAFQYYQIATDFGSVEALFYIVKLISEGNIEHTTLTRDEISNLCQKLLLLPNQSNKNKSVINCCMALMALLSHDIQKGWLYIGSGLIQDSSNNFLLLYKAFIEILNDEAAVAKVTLDSIRNADETADSLKKTFIKLIISTDGLSGIAQNNANFFKSRDLHNKLMSSICYGLYYQHYRKHEIALNFYQDGLRLNPKSKIILSLISLLNPTMFMLDDKQQQSNKTYPYELIFRLYSTDQKYQEDRLNLQLQAKKFRGYLVYIAKNVDQFELRFLDDCRDVEIKHTGLRKLSYDLVQTNQSEPDRFYEIMKQVHALMTSSELNLGRYPNPCHAIEDECNYSFNHNQDDDKNIETDDSSDDLSKSKMNTM